MRSQWSVPKLGQPSPTSTSRLKYHSKRKLESWFDGKSSSRSQDRCLQDGTIFSSSLCEDSPSTPSMPQRSCRDTLLISGCMGSSLASPMKMKDPCSRSYLMSQVLTSSPCSPRRERRDLSWFLGSFAIPKAAIDKQYRWGAAKQNSYRHAGTDLSTQKDAKFGRCLVVDQQFYIEMLQDFVVHPTRFSNGSSTMTPKEIAACRTSLGALQWLAVQSQPLITARCNLLITELSRDPKIQIAQELQEMIRELRKEGSTLKFFKLPGVRHWTDLCVVGLGARLTTTDPVEGRRGA